VSREGWDVYAKSVSLCLAACLLNAALNRVLTPWIRDTPLRWATAFSALQVIAILCMTLYLLARRAYARFQDGLHEQIRPAIQERVMALALAGETWSTPVPKHGPSRHVLEACIARALAGLKDSGRDSLAKFALEQGFTKQWMKTFSSGNLAQRKRAVSLLGLVSPVAGETIIPQALADQHPAIRTAAARALLVSGNAASVDLVFRSVLAASLLTRALLSSDLKRHARHLLAHTVPAVLAENAHANTRNTLEMLAVWGKAMPSLDIEALLTRQGDQLIIPLLALLPYVAVEDSIEVHILDALKSPDIQLQCAAARSAGRLQLNRVLPALLQALSQNRWLAVSSAAAITQMGTEGLRALESVIRGTDRLAAAAAMEALETMTVKAQ